MNEIPPLKILMFSKDIGHTWKREEPRISDAMGPIYFEKNRAIWAYGSQDRIQRREF